MIQEEYVSFDTAKMLKEAGFDIPTRGMYRTNRSGDYKFIEDERKYSVDDCMWDRTDGFIHEYIAPTQALAARWIREVHRLVIDVVFIPPSANEDYWQYFIGEMDDMIWSGDFMCSELKYGTYEQAMEAGLKKALEIIKGM